MKPYTTKELAAILERRCELAGVAPHHLVTYSPGDGVTRYRIVTGQNDYFGGYAVQTVLGRSNAADMVWAFVHGIEAAESAMRAGTFAL